MKFSHPIIDEVKRLGLPEPHNVIINHGAAMVIRGYRDEHDTGDIDMCVSQVNAEYLEQVLGFETVDKVVGQSSDGSDIIVKVRHDPARRFDVHVWDFSPRLYDETGKGRMDIGDQVPYCDQDEATGFWIAGKELLLLEKQGSDRPRDIEDVTILQSI